MAGQGAEIKAESELHLAGLEEKLAALQAELHGLQKEYAALLARVNACCHNETYYLAAVKDNVNAILAEVSLILADRRLTYMEVFFYQVRNNIVSFDIYIAFEFIKILTKFIAVFLLWLLNWKDFISV